MKGILETIQDIREQLNDIEKQFTTIRDSFTSMVVSNGGKKRGPKPGSKRGGRKRVMSPEARAKIAEAQKRRWAKQKAK